jgi:hypothetical protein
MNATGVKSVEPSTCFDQWCGPETETYESLSTKTNALRTIHDRDVKQIKRIFQKQKAAAKGSASPDYSISIDDLNDTIANAAQSIAAIEAKILEYKTKCNLVLFKLQYYIAPIYRLGQKGVAAVGSGGVAVGLTYGQKDSSTSETTNSSSSGTAPPILGWAGFGLVVAAFFMNWVKEYVDGQKMEQKKFEDLKEENLRMKSAHEATVIILQTLQETNLPEFACAPADLDQSAEVTAQIITQRVNDKLREASPRQEPTVPYYLQKALTASGVKRALLSEIASRSSRGSPPQSAPAMLGPGLSSSVAIHMHQISPMEMIAERKDAV